MKSISSKMKSVKRFLSAVLQIFRNAKNYALNDLLDDLEWVVINRPQLYLFIIRVFLLAIILPIYNYFGLLQILSNWFVNLSPYLISFIKGSIITSLLGASFVFMVSLVRPRKLLKIWEMLALICFIVKAYMEMLSALIPRLLSGDFHPYFKYNLNFIFILACLSVSLFFFYAQDSSIFVRYVLLGYKSNYLFLVPLMAIKKFIFYRILIVPIYVSWNMVFPFINSCFELVEKYVKFAFVRAFIAMGMPLDNKMMFFKPFKEFFNYSFWDDNVHMVTLMLSRGLKVDLDNYLVWAMSRRKDDLIKLLLSKNASLENIESERWRSDIRNIYHNDSIQAFRLLDTLSEHKLSSLKKEIPFFDKYQNYKIQESTIETIRSTLTKLRQKDESSADPNIIFHYILPYLKPDHLTKRKYSALCVNLCNKTTQVMDKKLDKSQQSKQSKKTEFSKMPQPVIFAQVTDSSKKQKNVKLKKSNARIAKNKIRSVMR